MHVKCIEILQKIITYHIILRIQYEIISIFIPSQKVRTGGKQVRLIQLNEH